MIDEIDKKILNLLQNNARISNAEIARRINMAPSGVLERIRKLEKKGVILGYETRLNHKILGLVLTVLILVKTKDAVGSTLIGEEIAKIGEVQEVFYIAGEYNYLVKARISDTDNLKELLKKFGDIGGVVDTRTTLVIDELLETLKLDLDGVEVRIKGMGKAK
ncbi:Lrp/AsnC family transcriptional regulator [Desulfothermus okinawensis JCM 13304]